MVKTLKTLLGIISITYLWCTPVLYGWRGVLVDGPARG